MRMNVMAFPMLPTAKHFLVAAACGIGLSFGDNAFACMCNCVAPQRGAETVALASSALANHDQVFSGMLFSAKTYPVPASAVHSTRDEPVEDPGSWVRYRMLVLKRWKGDIGIFATIWVRAATTCDMPPIPGSYFVALARLESGRSVAQPTFCNCDERDAVTRLPGTYVVGGIAILGAVIAALVAVLAFVIRVFRRRTHATRAA